LVTNFTATFKLFIGPFPNNNDGNPGGLGDGFSFNFGDSGSINSGAGTLGTLSDGISGANVLAVNVKTYATGATPQGVNVIYGGSIVTSFSVPQAALVNSLWVDVTIRLNADGTVDVDRDGVPVAHGVVLPGYVPVSNGTFLFGASCGGFWEHHNLDNIAILENAPLPPAQLTMTGNGSNLTFSWQPAGGRLQSTGALGSAWTDVPGSQPLTLPIGNSTAFFRVVVP
jgi:hypothetical protein